jgi:hypothetical protein
MAIRIFSIAIFVAGVAALLWNAWWRDSSFDVGMLPLFVAVFLMIAALGVAVLARRPQDKYWAFATIGLVLGFCLQR